MTDEQLNIRLQSRTSDEAMWSIEAVDPFEDLNAKIAKAVDALRLVTDACDEGKMVSLGAGGMTIDAQIRRSVYNQVPAWPIEEARVVLAELEK